MNGISETVRFIARVASTLILLGATATANADTTYLYTGESFSIFNNTSGGLLPNYTSTQGIVGTFTFTLPLAVDDDAPLPIDWSLSDGFQTLNPSNASLTGFQLHLNALGQFTQWNIEACTGTCAYGANELDVGVISIVQLPNLTPFDTGSLNRCTIYTSVGCRDVVFSTGASIDDIGQWSVASVPEPATLALLGLGLAGLGFSRRKQ